MEKPALLPEDELPGLIMVNGSSQENQKMIDFLA
jgi:hypothetical protein